LKLGLLKALKTGIRKEKTQEMFSVVVSIGVYVRGQLFEWPDIRKFYSVRINDAELNCDS